MAENPSAADRLWVKLGRCLGVEPDEEFDGYLIGSEDGKSKLYLVRPSPSSVRVQRFLSSEPLKAIGGPITRTGLVAVRTYGPKRVILKFAPVPGFVEKMKIDIPAADFVLHGAVPGKTLSSSAVPHSCRLVL